MLVALSGCTAHSCTISTINEGASKCISSTLYHQRCISGLPPEEYALESVAALNAFLHLTVDQLVESHALECILLRHGRIDALAKFLQDQRLFCSSAYEMRRHILYMHRGH